MEKPDRKTPSSDSYEYKPRPPSGRSSKKLRKQILVPPQPLDNFKEFHEEAEFGTVSLSLEIKILRREKANVEQQNNELAKALQAKTVEIESLIKHRERSEERIRYLNNEISDIQKSKRQTVNESLQQLLAENCFLKSTLEHRSLEIETLSKECEKQRRTREKGEHVMTELVQVVQEKTNEVEEVTTRLEEFSKKCSALHRDKEEAHAKIRALDDALYEKKREFDSLTNQLERYEEKISTLTKTVEDIKGSKNQAADENIKGLQKKIGSLESELRNATTESNENVDREEHTASANSILNEENASLKSTLSQLSHETEKKVSALTEEIKSLQKSKGISSEEYNARKLYEENEFLKVQLDRTSRSYEQLRKDYNEVKGEKDHALNSYDQKGRDSNEVKRERDHKRFNSGAEGYVHKDPKRTGLL